MLKSIIMSLMQRGQIIAGDFHRPIPAEISEKKTPGISQPFLHEDFKTIDRSTAVKVFTPVFINPGNTPIPNASTRNGNLFSDRFDKNTIWYLPEYDLAPDIDPNFSFLATQKNIPNDTGGPFYSTELRFSIQKKVPADATAARTANPSINLNEVTLSVLQVNLTVTYADQQGNELHSSYSGTVQSVDTDNMIIDINNIKGNQVLV